MVSIPRMDPRAERTAKNEALPRQSNNPIGDVGRHLQVLPDGNLLDFRCECGRPECEEFISMAVRKYEQVRAQNDRFALVPGHESDEIERVVERAEGYVIVDKLPAVERFVGA